MNQPVVLPRWTAPGNLAGARAAILALGRSIHEHTYLLGKTLEWVKSEVGHGHFKAWIAANVWFSARSAERFMKFARECDRAGELSDYSPNGKNDIMADLEVSGSGMSGFVVRRMKNEHARIRQLLSYMDDLWDELEAWGSTKSPPAPSPQAPLEEHQEWAKQLGERIRTGDRLIVNTSVEPFEAGEIPTTGGQILTEYGRFLVSLDTGTRRAFEDLEQKLGGDDANTETILNDWFRNPPDIHGERQEIGTWLLLHSMRIGRWFGGTLDDATNQEGRHILDSSVVPLKRKA